MSKTRIVAMFVAAAFSVWTVGSAVAQAPAPAAKPAAVPLKPSKKRVPTTHKGKGRAPAAATTDEAAEKPVEDAPMPPSAE